VHIPDGFLSAGVVASTGVVSATGVGLAARLAARGLGEKHIPLVGLVAAFIFAAQMLNFPVLGGTSGHLLGAALAAILLGPWTGLLVMSLVLIVQALVFQDGGLLALGANIFNMAMVGCFAGHVIYRGLRRLLGESRRVILASGFVAAWATVLVASAVAAAELAISGTSTWEIALPAMIGVHALIGIGEGAITAVVLSFLLATRRDLLRLSTC
jgi:cobalt/nickel transport system permease protein